jgi:hypothetical protein
MKKLHHICKELKDENEIAIIKKYGYIGKRFTVVFTSKIIYIITITYIIDIYTFPIKSSHLIYSKFY